MLKALVLKRTQELAPQIHDLRRLAEKAGLNFTEEQGKELDFISTFNIRARYDDTKRTFYQKATRLFALISGCFLAAKIGLTLLTA
ncbi:HEPN domain-containing protein [candidate division KSB1 bacterium]|nr:HEPN domain-containing protein [candidate division KSB1 bacterium]